MKSIFLISLVCFLSFSVQAQKSPVITFKITGKLIDSISLQPVEYATITIFPEGAKKPIDGTVSDDKGNFIVDNLASGTYKVVAEFIGYKAHTLNNITVNKEHPVNDVNNVSMQMKATTLQSVTISGRPNIIENKIDKMVFNADQDITSQVGVATDILKKVPQVSVDVDGNVELAGSSSIRFLINGKPSAAFGSNITDVLQSIPASQIKSIEVITTPGAKYDAQGLGGIINIILKKNNSQGINGNLSLTGGTRTENGSFNFNARNGNFGVNAYISGDARLKARSLSSSERVTNDTAANNKVFLNQVSPTDVKRSGYQAGLGFDWDINKYNSLSGSVGYENFGHNGNGMTYQTQKTKDVSDNILSDIEYSINADNKFQFQNADASINYKKTFKNEDQELDLSANTSIGKRNSEDNNYQYLLPQDSLFYSTRSKNPGTEKETEIRADYTQPLKKNILLGVGSKLGFYDITSNSRVSKLNSANNYVTDNYLSDNLRYHQKVYAFYTELTFPVFKLFDAKIGERYERTEINSYYSNAQQQEAVPGYNTFVPSIFFSKKLGNNSQIKLSYTKRIERPDYRDLNPFINTSDPKNLSTGNIHLSPEIGKRYELGYNIDIDKIGSFMINAFYRINDHDIQDYIVYYPSYQVGDSTYKDVALSTRQNIGRENNMGLNLYASAKFFSKLDLRANAFFYERHTINTIDKGYDYNSFNYRVNLNADYQFSKTLVAEFFGNFRSARHEVQGTYPSFTTYSLAVRKQFWNKKGSLAITASNPFQKNLVLNTKVFGPGFTFNQTRTVPFR
ncbi:MAG: TonB-dependent receptor domain-containing protein, partial [Ginsengibacter sp.]